MRSIIVHHADRPPEPEEDRLPYGRLVLVSVLALAAFTVGGLWSTYILYRPHEALVPEDREPRPTEVGKAEIGLVDQRLFGNERRAEDLRAEQLRRLSRYGWVDRERGLIHLPIDRAMQLLAEGRR